ncbi:hypothetical protein Tco_0596089 [Tanacetum coccineum]
MMKVGFLDSGGGGVKKKKKKDNVYAMESNESPLDATIYDATDGFVKNPSSVNVTVNDGLNKVNDKGFNSTGERRMSASLWTEATGYRSNFTFHGSKPTSTNPTDVIEAVKSSTTQDVNISTSINSDSDFPSLSEVISTIANKDGDLKEGNTVTIGSTSQADEVIATPSGMRDANTTTVNAGIPNEVGYESVMKVHEGRSSYARILIKIDGCNGFCDNLVMVAPNFDGHGYTKETICVEYKWEPPRCSTCLVFGHSVDDCPKAPKQAVNRVDIGKGRSPEDDDDDFIEVKMKKSGGNNGGTENFKPVLVKPKTIYRPKVNQSIEEMEGKCVLVDDDGKPLEKVDYSSDHDSEDGVESF